LPFRHSSSLAAWAIAELRQVQMGLRPIVFALIKQRFPLP
jgi:hypothetical protein